MKFFKKKRGREIELDEILLDASNLPSFNRGRLEGRLELPISAKNFIAIGVVFALIASIFAFQLVKLQIVSGESYAQRSADNRLNRGVIFAPRGVIYDRTGELIAWNEDAGDAEHFPVRAYTDRRGISHALGYVSYPQRDAQGYYYRIEYEGRGGVEESYNAALAGRNGEQLIEADAHGQIVSGHIYHEPEPGKPLTLTLDAELSEKLYDIIATTTLERGFRSGAGAIMDVETGELIAVASFPDFDPEVMADGENADLIASYNTDERLPFLNKLLSGVYTPGSVVKPFVALGALENNIVSPEKEFVSTGSLVVPNPYNPDNPTTFADWRAHGVVDMRRAIAVSSNVYFYYVGGGFGEQKGLGITKMYDFFRRYGFGERTGINLPGEVEGIVPNPQWKEKAFEDGTWRLGDTYLTAIGQFGFQSTPIQLLRAYAAIANGGTLLEPIIVEGEESRKVKIDLDPNERQVVIEGMRGSATDGTARALNIPGIEIAAKTGTAEVGASKAFVNSWVAGFYPYEKPKYAFVLMMEHGPRENLFGSSPAFYQMLIWMRDHKPEYFNPSGTQID